MIEKCDFLPLHFIKLILTGRFFLRLSNTYVPLLRISCINRKAVVKRKKNNRQLKSNAKIKNKIAWQNLVTQILSYPEDFNSNLQISCLGGNIILQTWGILY